jgi:hypothetical protein
VIRVNVLSPGFTTPNGLAFLFPLVVWREALRAADINLRVFHTIAEPLTDCDVLVIDSKFHRDRWKYGVEPVVEEFAALKRQVPRLVYFDTTDSTGCLQVELLPVVDAYCKNQILLDRGEYKRAHYGQRIYADYYHRHDGVQDESPLYSNTVEDPAHLAKLRVGWNSGLANYSAFGPYFAAAYRWLPLPSLLGFAADFTAPAVARPVALQSRFGFGHGRESVSHQRRRIVEQLGAGNTAAKLNRSAYFAELQKTWAVLSPFGLGEITLRDFEVFLTGGLLVKPSMKHLETWPALFDDDCMVSFAWDLSDLGEVLDRIQSDRQGHVAIAMEGQRRYRNATIGAGAAEAFSKHVRQIWLQP